ncbi:hypothetical protein [Flavobacterium sp. NRK1]|jgi:hypothetical protein|uniref:hypothetical protein n=1 Tax=Flavobacterium sp. NRK1 TaxID=2954929 RepID=UPI002092177F|nr:hypothetical protein [Flavobacterium sp. NRK1]MCO6148399.1 hypothetical protein [Flavobacterium sp. NRK1]
MPYTTEIIIAATITVAAFLYFLRPKYKKEKLLLLTKYRRVRTKSLEIQDSISKYILTNDALDDNFLPDLTYGQFMRKLKKAHSLYLSEKTYVKLKNSSNIFFLKKTGRLLDEQEKHLDDIEKKLLFEKPEIA